MPACAICSSSWEATPETPTAPTQVPSAMIGMPPCTGRWSPCASGSTTSTTGQGWGGGFTPQPFFSDERLKDKIHIIGKTKERSATPALIERLGLTGHVEFVSGVPQERIVELYAEAEVAVVLKEHEDGTWRVSMRSRGNIDVAAACISLGGGGHRFAAGYTASGAVEAVMQQIRAALAN